MFSVLFGRCVMTSGGGLNLPSALLMFLTGFSEICLLCLSAPLLMKNGSNVLATFFVGAANAFEPGVVMGKSPIIILLSCYTQRP